MDREQYLHDFFKRMQKKNVKKKKNYWLLVVAAVGAPDLSRIQIVSPQPLRLL